LLVVQLGAKINGRKSAGSVGRAIERVVHEAVSGQGQRSAAGGKAERMKRKAIRISMGG
jgi:hypothetical protein